MRAVVRFYAELKDFLGADNRSGTVVHTFRVPGSVKDVIESHGVPHTELELILVGGESVDFSYQVQDGDRISVYPVFESFDVASVVRVRPEPMRQVRFVLDGHLGTLARYLRLLGFDTAYAPNPPDRELIRVATTEGRILLTRDVALLKHRSITHGHFVPSDDPRRQVLDVIARFQLGARLQPYSRCVACNGVLEPVVKEAIAHRLPPLTRQYIDRFWTCPDCGKDYWRGAHARELDRIVAAAQGT
ncbi:MAG: Mut7-C RNAse domain-containing protein [Candidatus Limnocylindria bacterium]